MDSPEGNALSVAWSIAARSFPRHAAQRVLAGLAPDVSALLLDGCGSRADAARLLEVHAAEAWVAERIVLHCGGSGLVQTLKTARADPASAMVSQIPAAQRKAARRKIDKALAPLLSSDPPEGEALFVGSFSTRAQKRRGGVYTRPALVNLLLDLIGWRGQGRLLEPAAGAGAFLLRAWERALDSGVPASRLAKRLVGNDVHPFACRAARTGLALAAATRGTSPSHVPKVSRADALVGPSDAPTEKQGAYDFVVGNPPWVRGERIPAHLREAYRNRVGALGKGNVDLASFFVRRAFDWLAPGGTLAFVITQGLLESRSSAGLRDFLAEHTVESLVTLEWAPPQFAEATVIPCLVVVSKRPPPLGHTIPLGICRGDDDLRWTRVLQKSWLALTRGTTRPWPLLLERGDLGFLKRLRRQPTPFRAGYGLAVRTRTGARSLISEGPPPASFQSPQPLLDGREVRAWAIDYRGRSIDYRPELISDAKTPAFFAGPKVVVPRIALSPQAAVDDGPRPYYARNTVMILRAPDTVLDAAPHAVAALINSLPVRAYAFLLLRAGVLAGSHRATFYSGMLNGLPVPQRVLDEPRLRKRLSTLGERARDLAVLGKQKRLLAVEAKIDEAVALAFGLSPSQLATLRTRAARDPLRAILQAPRAGDRTRKIAVAEYSAGNRYR